MKSYPEQKMSSPDNSALDRRYFIGKSLKLVTLASILLPLQKAFGNGTSLINKVKHGKRKTFFVNKLVLNTKTNTVHLPSNKIFANYDELSVRHQKIIDLATWETIVKSPIHFHKEKSGIILEMLALQKLVPGINDKNLTDAIHTIGIAFTPVYKNAKGVLINKYNFRLHELLATLIGLNNSILSFGKWPMFQNAIGKQDYFTNEKGFPGYMNWIKTKDDFDKRVIYIAQNRTEYMARLKERVANYKL